MATKKQKHAAAVARREEYLAKERAIGQKAIEVDRRRREARAREAWAQGHKKHYKFVDECPHCSDIKKEQARQVAAEAVERVAAAAKKAAKKATDARTPISHLADQDEAASREEQQSA